MSGSRLSRLLPLGFAVPLLAGCTSYHVARLTDVERAPASARCESAAALQACRGLLVDHRATQALIRALDDPDVHVRARAAEALQAHLQRRADIPEKVRIQACERLIAHLDDREMVPNSYLIAHMGIIATCQTAPPRYWAAMALCAALGADHGFDQDAWRGELEQEQRRFLPRMQAPDGASAGAAIGVGPLTNTDSFIVP
jgi:hypothetical protein